MTTSPSVRARAIDRAAELRVLHQSLASEFRSSAAPGHVLALAVRSARALRRSGCGPDFVAVSTERLVRAALATTA